MVSLILWLIFEIEDCDKEGMRKRLLGVLFVVCFACCSIAASRLVTIPITLALWGRLYLIRTKRWRDIINVCVCAIPVAACALPG